MKIDFEKYAQQLISGEHGQELQRLTQSEDGVKLAQKLDGAALETAVKAGDGESLSKLIQGILSTPEGQNFARQVQRTVSKDGR
jgi:hypothetical protein